MRALNPAYPGRPRPLLYALFPINMLFCPPMANPPPSLSLATLLEITESGAHSSNPFIDHHPPAQHQSRSSPRYRRCRLWWVSACWGNLVQSTAARSRPAYLAAGDEAVASGERNSNALANIVGDPSMAGPAPGVGCNKDCPQLLALLRAPSSLI